MTFGATRKKLLLENSLYEPPSLAELLEFARHGAGLELVVGAKGVLAGRLARHASEDHAIEQGVAPQAVVAMDAARSLAGDVEAGDHLTGLVDALGVHGALQAAHAIVDHRGDDSHVEGLLGHRGAVDDVVVELLAAARLAAGLVPSLSGGVRRERAAFGILLLLLGRVKVALVCVDEGL